VRLTNGQPAGSISFYLYKQLHLLPLSNSAYFCQWQSEVADPVETSLSSFWCNLYIYKYIYIYYWTWEFMGVVYTYYLRFYEN